MKEFGYFDENSRGTLRRFEYTGVGGANKYAMVYLPHGYNNDPLRRYNFFYLMHGGGGNPDAWTDSCPMKNMLDRCFASGEAEPMIVVFPTFYPGNPLRSPGQVDEQYELQNVLSFQRELTVDLIPAAETAFRGFARAGDPDSLKRERAHRGFGGFSMGSVNTWYALDLHLDYFSVFMPISGDAWELGPLGGGKKPRETAQCLRNSILDSGFGPEDFAIFAATGTKDIAYPNLTPQIEAMSTLDDVFRLSDDFSWGNLHYLVGQDMAHTYDSAFLYFYNLLPHLFQ